MMSISDKLTDRTGYIKVPIYYNFMQSIIKILKLVQELSTPIDSRYL